MSVRLACCISGVERIRSLVLLQFRQALPPNRQFLGRHRYRLVLRVVQSLMLQQILQLLWRLHRLLMIGIILLATIHCGQPLTRPNQFTTHVQPAGVFLMVEVVTSGQRPWVHRQFSLKVHFTTVPIKA